MSKTSRLQQQQPLEPSQHERHHHHRVIIAADYALPPSQLYDPRATNDLEQSSATPAELPSVRVAATAASAVAAAAAPECLQRRVALVDIKSTSAVEVCLHRGGRRTTDCAGLRDKIPTVYTTYRKTCNRRTEYRSVYPRCIRLCVKY